MGEYADMEIERQMQSFADKAMAESDRIFEVKKARKLVQALGLDLVQKTAHHYHVTRARPHGKPEVIAQWWPTRGQTMLNQTKGPRCKGAADLAAWLKTAL